jgi:hypothetical protein
MGQIGVAEGAAAAQLLTLTRTREGPGFSWRLDMREIVLAILVAPVLFVLLWLVMAMF